MDRNRVVDARILLPALSLCLVLVSVLFTLCEARKSTAVVRVEVAGARKKTAEKVEKLEDMNGVELDSSNTGPYGVSSPFSLPPYDSLPPIPLPQNAPPFCVYPPVTPQPPTYIPTPLPPFTGGGGGLPPPYSSIPTPTLPIENPPASPSPPEYIPFVPSPPEFVPSPTGPFLSPPPYYEEPSPRTPVFQPPVVYPPPTVPPPPERGPTTALWCVAKPSVPEPIIEAAMNYACGSGADCYEILPNGSCFMPDTYVAHASYAFNSYWQRTKVAGGTCEFGGTAILVTVDPSYDGCHFIYN